MSQTIQSFLKKTINRLYLFDKLIFGYLIVLPLLILITGKELPILQRMLWLHPLMMVTFGALIYFEPHLPSWVAWLRYWYPIIGFTFFFGMVAKCVNLFFPFWFEPFLLRSDIWLFGDHAWRAIASGLDKPTVEVLAFAYWSYYAIIPAIPLLHFLKKRAVASSNGRQTIGYERVMSRLTLSLMSCYILFMLFPARGPHHVFSLNFDSFFQGGFFYHFVLFIQGQASVVGAAFPSSHVAAAWTLYLTLRHDFKRTYLVLLPLLILLSVSVFMLQYHYVLDAVAGLVLALLLESIMSVIERKPKNLANLLPDVPAIPLEENGERVGKIATQPSTAAADQYRAKS